MRLYHYLYLLFFLVTIILSFVYKDKLKGSALQTLPYSLSVIWLVDVASLMLVILFKKYNVWLINLLVDFQLLYVFGLYYFLFRTRKYKIISLLSAVFFQLLFVGRLIYFGNWNIYQEFSFFAGTFLQIVVLLLFLLEMLQSDDFLYIHHYTVFWVTLAFLLYWVIPFPVSFWLYSFYKYGSEYMAKLSAHIQFVANLLMYFSLIFGFIWSKRRYKL